MVTMFHLIKMKKRNYIMNTKNKLFIIKKGFFFLFTIIISAVSLIATAQEGCLNICPDDDEKQINVSGEDQNAVNGIVCINDLTGENIVIQNGDALNNLPQAMYACYTVAISEGSGFDIASIIYSIGNVQAELDMALIMTDDCGSVAPEATIIDVNSSHCSPTEKFCLLDVCLCNEDTGTDFVFGYTPTGDDGEQVFLVVNDDGTVVAVEANTTISAIGLAEGTYEIYALIYDAAKAGNLVTLISTGNAIADILSELSDTACGTFSGPIEASVNAEICDCNEPPETKDCATDICPCKGDVHEINLSTSNYTGGDNQQWYVVVSGGSIVTSQLSANDGSVSFANLPDGEHQIYAVNYNPAEERTLTTALANGNAWTIVEEGITDGTYCADFIGPQDISINAAACGCEPVGGPCIDSDNEAGVMSYPQGLDVCFGSTANTTTAGTVISAGSSLSYILHDGDNANLGSTIDFNTTGLFTNNGAYPTGVELYICAVVGPGVGTFPDLESECTDISDNCTPVHFLSQVLIDSEVVCDGSGNYSVLFELSGGLPATEIGSLYSVSGDYTGLVPANTSTSIGSLSAGSFYSLNVTDNAGCSAVVSSEKIVCEKLPIELISYTGAVQTQGNMLKWITASEIENDYFTLQRSIDGVNFEKIHTQKGAGTINTPQSYSYLDREAPNGLSYYKLWQTDNDGTINDVGIVSLLRGETSLGINSLLPIPVLSILELTYTSNLESQVELQIYNALGKKLNIKIVGANKGLNQATINVSTYPSGIYFLTLIQGKEILTEKFIKE